MKKENKKILYLPLKKEWYNMIESGEKKEEYRELSNYWYKRLMYKPFIDDSDNTFDNDDVKPYDYVRFSYGYTKRNMTYKCNKIRIGEGKKEWGAPNGLVFIIELGDKVE